MSDSLASVCGKQHFPSIWYNKCCRGPFGKCEDIDVELSDTSRWFVPVNRWRWRGSVTTRHASDVRMEDALWRTPLMPPSMEFSTADTILRGCSWRRATTSMCSTLPRTGEMPPLVPHHPSLLSQWWKLTTRCKKSLAFAYLLRAPW